MRRLPGTLCALAASPRVCCRVDGSAAARRDDVQSSLVGFPTWRRPDPASLPTAHGTTLQRQLCNVMHAAPTGTGTGGYQPVMALHVF